MDAIANNPHIDVVYIVLPTGIQRICDQAAQPIRNPETCLVRKTNGPHGG
ncbi:MAG: hypothetical protein R2788_10620 [Saprospiraceae bacterium]